MKSYTNLPNNYEKLKSDELSAAVTAGEREGLPVRGRAPLAVREAPGVEGLPKKS